MFGIWYSTLSKKKGKIYFLLLMKLKKMSICGQFALTMKNTKSYWDPSYHVVEESFFLSCPIHHINRCMSPCCNMLVPRLFLQDRTIILSLQLGGLSSAEFFPSLLQSIQQIQLLVDLWVLQPRRVEHLLTAHYENLTRDVQRPNLPRVFRW